MKLEVTLSNFQTFRCYMWDNLVSFLRINNINNNNNLVINCACHNRLNHLQSYIIYQNNCIKEKSKLFLFIKHHLFSNKNVDKFSSVNIGVSCAQNANAQLRLYVSGWAYFIYKGNSLNNCNGSSLQAKPSYLFNLLLLLCSLCIKTNI